MQPICFVMLCNTASTLFSFSFRCSFALDRDDKAHIEHMKVLTLAAVLDLCCRPSGREDLLLRMGSLMQRAGPV